MTKATALLGLLLLSTLWAPVALAASPAAVLVLPPLVEGLPASTAETVASAVAAAVRDQPESRVIDARSSEHLGGVDLAEQAAGCRWDELCLTELASLVGASAVAMSSVSEAGDGRWAARVRHLDVRTAAVVGEVIHVATAELSALGAAAAGAARRLFLPPTVHVEWVVYPPSARVSVFGEALALPEDGRIDWWPGRWQLELRSGERPPRVEWVELAGPAARVELSALTAPIAVGGSPDRPPAVIGRAPEPPSRWGRPLPWVSVGVGLLAAGAGAVLMVDAQARYADVAADPRYQLGMGASARDAAAERDDLRSRHTGGAIAAGAGGALALGGLVYMLVVDPEGAER